MTQLPPLGIQLSANAIIIAECFDLFGQVFQKMHAVSCVYVSILKHKQNIKESTHKDDITPISWP